jgi:hypothetical protein
MGVCEVCGNDYDKAMEVMIGGETHVFDSFECAINALAPRCAHCHCTIIGHGVESDSAFYCCAHCAHTAGVPQGRPRIGQARASNATLDGGHDSQVVV